MGCEFGIDRADERASWNGVWVQALAGRSHRGWKLQRRDLRNRPKQIYLVMDRQCNGHCPSNQKLKTVKCGNIVNSRRWQWILCCFMLAALGLQVLPNKFLGSCLLLSNLKIGMGEPIILRKLYAMTVLRNTHFSQGQAKYLFREHTPN